MDDSVKTIESGQLQLVSFLLGKEIFAIDVMKIQGVERVPEITEIPRFPASVEGVINLRGEIIPIVDLRKRFGIEAGEHGKETRIVLVELQDMAAGLIVDRVYEVLQLGADEIGKVPRLFRSSIDTRFVRGVAEVRDKLVIILDIDRIFSEDEIEDMAAGLD